MVLDTWSDVLVTSFAELWIGIATFIPNLIAAIAILILGWVVGLLIGRLVEQVLKSLKVDQALRAAGGEELLSKAGFSLNTGGFVGGLIKWFIIIAFLVASLDVLGLNTATTYLTNNILPVIPNIIISVLIVLAAAVIAEALQNIVVAALSSAGYKSAKLFGAITRWSIWILGIFVALDQLSIAQTLISSLINGVVVAFSLAIGLAFGLGGQDAAREYIAKVRKEIANHSHAEEKNKEI
ncbi:MAG: hypothetical protein WDZ88_03195 [Candidatus Paceibacterota bacterium]